MATQGCPCGYLGERRHKCKCTSRVIRRYRLRISGPLLVRIDRHIEVPTVTYPELVGEVETQRSADVAARVEAARQLQSSRFEGLKGLYANAQMGAREVKQYCAVDEMGLALLRGAMARLGLSARSFHRILKIARTVADLGGAEAVKASHISEAIGYRGLDRNALDTVGSRLDTS